MPDATDRRLLRLMQNAPQATPSALATQAGLSQSQASRRLAKLREDGTLRGAKAVIDWAALGYAARVSLRVTLDKADPRAFDAFLAGAREIPEVTQIQTFLGRVDVRLEAVARDMTHWQHLYRTRILSLPHIQDIEALMHVATIKSDERLPL